MQYFSQAQLGPGVTTRTFTLPPMNTGDNSGARYFQLTINRDAGLLLASGDHDANQSAVVTVQQLAADGTTQNTLLVTNAAGGVSGDLFMFDPTLGVLSIVNAGPGYIQSVTVEDGDNR